MGTKEHCLFIFSYQTNIDWTYETGWWYLKEQKKKKTHTQTDMTILQGHIYTRNNTN